MRYGVALPQLADGGFDAALFRRFLARAEELGMESVWVQEQVIGPSSMLSPLETLSFAAACSQRVRLGCAVLVTPLHSPVHLAREVATLDQLSGGRLELGVVAGGKGRPFAAFGLSSEGALARFEEGLKVMERLWSEPEVTLTGRFLQLERATMGLKPVQRPHPPIWFGGNHPDALRRAVRLGQGFIGAGSQPTERYASQVATVRAELEARHQEGFRIAKRVYLALDDDAGRARQRLTEVLGIIYPRLSADEALSFTVHGPPDACVEGLQAVADAGAELIVLNPLFDELEQMERLAAEVLPRLTGASRQG